MRVWMALGGAVVGLGVMGGVVGVLGLGVWALAVAVALVLGVYALAVVTGGVGRGEFLRGLLIGLNAGLNGWLGRVVAGLFLGPVAATGVGLALALLNLLAAVGRVARRRAYQALLGWSNGLLPMAWPVVGLGLLFFALNLLGHLILGLALRLGFFRISGLAVDWKTGTLFTRGGWVSNLNPLHTAFNMGNLAFVDRRSDDCHKQHEAGHTLNLAVFGSLFHLIGAVDESVFGNNECAYAERLAESNVAGSTQDKIIRMWL